MPEMVEETSDSPHPEVQMAVRALSAITGLVVLASFFLPWSNEWCGGRVSPCPGTDLALRGELYLFLAPLAGIACIAGQLVRNLRRRANLVILCGAVAAAIPYDYLFHRWAYARESEYGAWVGIAAGVALVVMGGVALTILLVQRRNAGETVVDPLTRSVAGIFMFVSFFLPWFYYDTVIMMVFVLYGWDLIAVGILPALSLWCLLGFAPPHGKNRWSSAHAILAGSVGLALAGFYYSLFELDLFPGRWLREVGTGWVLAVLGSGLAVLAGVIAILRGRMMRRRPSSPAE